jgi:hypothetical protein
MNRARQVKPWLCNQKAEFVSGQPRVQEKEWRNTKGILNHPIVIRIILALLIFSIDLLFGMANNRHNAEEELQRHPMSQLLL